MPKYNFSNALLFILVLLLTSNTSAVEAPLWQQFKTAKATGSEPTLPDFSYAGYDYSESDIPDTSDWTVFNVTAYGAVADDGNYDDEAIQATIDAAEAAGGGVVLFPSGRFMISPNETVGENIFIHASNIVLKGQGTQSGGTEIFMDKKKVQNGRHIFEITPTSTSESTITEVVKDASRETFEIEVEDASQLSVGQRIILRADSIVFGQNYYAPQTIDTLWTRLLTNGFQIREIHTISKINGNILRLREPLHISLDVDAGQIRVRSYNMLNNVGIEDILFKGLMSPYSIMFKTVILMAMVVRIIVTHIMVNILLHGILFCRVDQIVIIFGHHLEMAIPLQCHFLLVCKVKT